MAKMEDGTDPGIYPFKTHDGRTVRGYFGDPNGNGQNANYAFIEKMIRSIGGGAFSFRYNTITELANKNFKFRFKVVRDPNYDGDVPFFVGGSMKSFDKNVTFIRSVFKFESSFSKIRHYPIKINHRVFDSLEDRDQGILKPNIFSPPSHKVKIGFQGADPSPDSIPLQEVNYSTNNPLSLCYYYSTKRKVGE